MRHLVYVVLLSAALQGPAVRKHAHTELESMNATTIVPVVGNSADLAVVRSELAKFPFEYLVSSVKSVHTLMTGPLTVRSGTAAVLDIATVVLALTNPGLAASVGLVRGLFDPPGVEPDLGYELEKLRSEILSEVRDMIDSSIRTLWNKQIQTELSSIAQIVEECCHGDGLGKFGILVTRLETMSGAVALMHSKPQNTEGGMSILSAIFYWNFYLHVGIQHAVMKLDSGHKDAEQHAQGRQGVVKNRAKDGVKSLQESYFIFKNWRLSTDRFEPISYSDDDKVWYRESWYRKVKYQDAKDRYTGKTYTGISGCRFWSSSGTFRMLKKGAGSRDYYAQYHQYVRKCIKLALEPVRMEVTKKFEPSIKELCLAAGVEPRE